MSTASLNQPTSPTIPRPSAAIRRFAWKEYRTLRGFWLAVLIVGLAIQWFSGVVLPPQNDWPVIRLTIALAAATLYAAGAAAILFAVEHEEQTYDFLNGLPTTWLSIFAGKLLLVTASAIVLAAALIFAGLMTGGFKLPNETNASQAFGIFGVAIFEAIIWGTLFSLLFKRPLAAAITTLVVGTLAVHMAVNATAASGMASLDPQAYVRAIPLRLAIILAVFSCCILVARRWLTFNFPSSRRGGTRGEGIVSNQQLLQNPYGLTTVLTTSLNLVRPLFNRIALRANRGRRATMLARLLWQTWRESWKWLPVPLVVSGFLLLGILLGVSNALQLGITADANELLIVATIFFAPALYGALAFSADQRRGQLRFLAEHAAAPRYVWLARHIVWLGALIVLSTVIVIALAILVVIGLQYTSQRALQYNDWNNLQPYVYTLEQYQAVSILLAGGALASYGLFTAYTIGQLCSMTLRSEILAGFLALLLSVILSAWVSVLFVWGLSGWLFLFPLAVGLMLATWLRAPDWIAGRNTWRAWAKPVLAIVISLFLVGFLLPQMRLSQVRHFSGTNPDQLGQVAESPETTATLKELNEAAEKTAQMYLNAAALLVAPLTDDPLEPWSDPKYSAGLGSDDEDGFDESLIPTDQLDAFHVAKKKSRDLEKERHEAAIQLALETSQRPTCRFKFNLSPNPRLDANNRNYNLRLEPDRTFEALNSLLAMLTYPTIYSDVTLEQFLAGLRMSAHLRSGQPAAIFIRQLEIEQGILKRISEWAASDERTNDDRREAIEKLQVFFDTRRPSLAETFWADDALIHAVVAGQELPLVLAEKPVSIATYLAYLANELPWERERALEALDIVTSQNVQEGNRLTNALQNLSPNGFDYQYLRRFLQPGLVDQDNAWGTLLHAAATSYLMRFEYDARVPTVKLFREYLNTKTWERAVLTQIALAMYRKDHGEYPSSLAALVPDYLDHELLDPYSAQPFGYAPAGLDAPLTGLALLEGHELPPHTPLLWSAGPYNTHLTLGQRDISARDEEHPDAERNEELKPYYRLLEETPFYSHGWTELVFPVPR